MMNDAWRIPRLTIFLGSTLIILALSGCTQSIQPIRSSKAGLPFKSQIFNELKGLPPPTKAVLISIYKFRDQTGQYKPGASNVTYSTAVTQGGTAMLIKVLQDAGNGRWFSVLEREALANLLNERKIIRQTRKQYSGNQTQMKSLPPLLYAPIILEGGIIAYESNLLSGGIGARYLGIGGSTEFQRDTVTIYLRAISVKTGEILKSVNTSKTIFSVKMESGVFKFIAFQQLLEAELGYTTNEPPQMAVKEAIEKAVYDLILEGAVSGLWYFKDKIVAKELLANYTKEQQDYLEHD